MYSLMQHFRLMIFNKPSFIIDYICFNFKFTLFFKVFPTQMSIKTALIKTNIFSCIY